MRIHVDQIPDDGLTVDFSMEEAWAVQAATTALEVRPHQLVGELRVRRLGADLAVSGSVRTELGRDCDRCGEELDGILEGQVALTYTSTSERGFDDAPQQLAPDELDVGFFDGEFLDLGAVVEEQLVLLLPLKLACDLPGFRPTNSCARERLQQAAQGRDVDPRFAVLADLKIEG